MEMSIEEKKNAISKLMELIKPKGVLFVEFDLDPVDIRDKEYYMYLKYVVPDDSDVLRSKSMRESDLYRIEWNKKINRDIRNYLNIDTIITSSSITSESYYKKLKEKNNG